MKKFKFLIVFLFLFCLDRWAKNTALGLKIFDHQLIQFGLSKNSRLFFRPINQNLLIFISFLLLVSLFVFLIKNKQNVPLFSFLWLIALGGISNLFDRIRYGFVIDYFWIFFLPFSWFNLADLFILTGCLGGVLFLLKKGQK